MLLLVDSLKGDMLLGLDGVLVVFEWVLVLYFQRRGLQTELF